jgi:hypothetical protein
MQLATPHPNTCTRCGQILGAVCYAESMDAALAGLAWCEACEAPAEAAEAKPAPKRVRK